MPPGSCHLGPWFDKTLARAARSRLGGAWICSAGREKNSKKRGGAWGFVWVTHRRRAGLEQGGSARSEGTAPLLQEARGQLLGGTGSSWCGSPGEGKERKPLDIGEKSALLGNYWEKEGGERTRCFWKLKRCSLACLWCLLLEEVWRHF